VGDLIWINFDPQAGREQAGKRPALVLSPKSYNSITRLCVLCPVTSQVKGYPFEVAIPDDAKIGGGVVLSDQVKSLSWEYRGAEFGCVAPPEVVTEVKARIKSLLQFD
jgi:mRNA interferase MazF